MLKNHAAAKLALVVGILLASLCDVFVDEAGSASFQQILHRILMSPPELVGVTSHTDSGMINLNAAGRCESSHTLRSADVILA